MKTIKLSFLLSLCLTFTVAYAQHPKVHKVTFGIYETAPLKELPVSFLKTLEKTNITIEKNIQEPILGFIEKDDPKLSMIELSIENFKIIRTFYTVDKDKKYLMLVVVKRNPVIDISDINSTECKGKIVEIHFNLKGARKWAELTKNNIGKMVAFTIDNQIYTLPKIMTEIRNGESIINGLESEAIAKKISEALNASL